MKEYIVVVKNAVPLELCDSILKEYQNTKEWEITLTANNSNEKERNCDSIKISHSLVINHNAKRKEIDNKLYESASKCINKYNNKFKYAGVQQDTGYELLRYQTGGFYKEHTDSYLQEPRLISCSFALNDNYKGGEFAFFDNEIQYKLSKGDALMFPSTFTYPHQILPVTKGIRYSIITWFR